MRFIPGVGEQINSFALVSYIPGPLGSFLNTLRRELVPGCKARSHATILCPRTLNLSAEAAAGAVQAGLQGFAPFRLALNEIEVFESTSVVYLGVGPGATEMARIHRTLNSDGLAFDEPHAYHPHVTLAQDIGPEQVSELFALAKRRWAEFSGDRHYSLEVLTFVQNTAENQWVDLGEFPLAEPVGSVMR